MSIPITEMCETSELPPRFPESLVLRRRPSPKSTCSSALQFRTSSITALKSLAGIDLDLSPFQLGSEVFEITTYPSPLPTTAFINARIGSIEPSPSCTRFSAALISYLPSDSRGCN